MKTNAHTPNRDAWQNGQLVPCEECWGEGMTAHQNGSAIRTEICTKCEGSGYVMESTNDDA